MASGALSPQDGCVNSAIDASSASDDNWFSVRCVFQFEDDTTAFEERVTLWRGANFDDAIALAEAEAEQYAGLVGSRYLGLAQAYHLADDVEHGAEVSIR